MGECSQEERFQSVSSLGQSRDTRGGLGIVFFTNGPCKC